MRFAQGIRVRCGDAEALQRLLAEWDQGQASSEVMGYIGTRLLADRDQPGQYLILAEFAEAVRTQPIGEIGQPVQTQYGFHIIRVDSRETKPFAEVKDEVRQAFTSSQQGPFNSFLTNASTKAKVEINPRYGTFDKSGESAQVVPPKTPDAAG